LHARTARGQGSNGGGCAGMVIADFGGGGQRSRWFVERNPITAVHNEFVATQRGVVADDDAVCFRVEFHYIEGFRRRKTESLALTNSIKLDALMVAEHFALEVHNFAAMFLREICLLEKPAVVVV